MIFALVPPAVPELGNATGFDLWLVDETNMGHEKLLAVRNQLLGIAGGDKRVAQVRPVSLEDAPQLQIKIAQDKANADRKRVEQGKGVYGPGAPGGRRRSK